MSPRRIAQGQLEQLEAQWRRAFGWAELSIDVEAVDPNTIALRGEVVLGRSIPNIVAHLQLALPAVRVVSRLREQGEGTWHRWDGILPLSPGLAGAGLATELGREDGPVECRAEVGSMMLVRARDGTAGWARRTRLGLAPRPDAWGPVDVALDGFEAAARSFVGTRYRLGGTTHEGIDCSGLVQRAARACCVIPVPRHSADQRGLAVQADSQADPTAHASGLAFVWTAEEAPCHVGVLAAQTVIHASRSRSMVVEDDRDSFFHAATRVDFVVPRDLEIYWSGLVGARRVPESALGTHRRRG